MQKERQSSEKPRLCSNALSTDMMNTLHDAITEHASTCRALIIAHEGPAFSAGHDLKELKSNGAAEHNAIFALCTKMVNAITVGEECC